MSNGSFILLRFPTIHEKETNEVIAAGRVGVEDYILEGRAWKYRGA